MNKNEFEGGARYIGGKVEKAVGDTVNSRDLQVDGVVDQVGGAAQNIYGRARSVAEDAVDAAPQFADHARATLSDAADRSLEVAREGLGRARETARDGKDAVVTAVSGNPIAAWAVAAALGGYALGWLIHGRRA